MTKQAATFLVGLVTSAALATGTVTVTLSSSKAGQTVAPGTSIDWTVSLTVSTGDNYGLALIAGDLVHDANNPAKFDLPPGNAGSIPAAMSGFNRPAGISNPGEGGAPSGYIGVQRGTAGEKILKQLGGAQNTFGVAGSSMGTDPIVEGGIGQSGSQVILSGSFPAPSTLGTYTYRLQNAVANVLTQVNTPPAFSTVAQATVNLDAASFTVTVGESICRGDCDCDGDIDFDDINPFVAALGGATPCSFANCDVDASGVIDFNDINPFVAAIGQACP